MNYFLFLFDKFNIIKLIYNEWYRYKSIVFPQKAIPLQ